MRCKGGGRRNGRLCYGEESERKLKTKDIVAESVWPCDVSRMRCLISEFAFAFLVCVLIGL